LVVVMTSSSGGRAANALQSEARKIVTQAMQAKMSS
jgi:hypothetical protein